MKKIKLTSGNSITLKEVDKDEETGAVSVFSATITNKLVLTRQ